MFIAVSDFHIPKHKRLQCHNKEYLYLQYVTIFFLYSITHCCLIFPSDNNITQKSEIGPQIWSDWTQMGQIFDFLRSVSVHFGSASQNVLKLILKSQRIFPFGVTLTVFRPKSIIPGVTIIQLVSGATVEFSLCHFAILSFFVLCFCHSVTLSLCHYVICHHVTLSLCHYVICHPVTMPLCHLSPCHYVTMPLCHLSLIPRVRTSSTSNPASSTSGAARSRQVEW